MSDEPFIMTNDEHRIKMLELKLEEALLRISRLEEDFYDTDSENDVEEVDEQVKKDEIDKSVDKSDLETIPEKVTKSSPSNILKYQDTNTKIIPVYLNDKLVFYCSTFETALEQCHKLFKLYQSQNLTDNFIVEEGINTVSLLKKNKLIFSLYHSTEHVFTIGDPIYSLNLEKVE
jgi:hypothetical protein